MSNTKGSKRLSVAAQRKADERTENAKHRILDQRHGVMVSTLAHCPHGTARGYQDFGCRCLDLGEPRRPPGDPHGPLVPYGCRPAGVTASANRRRTRRNATQATDELPVVPQHHPGTDSALAQLDRIQMRTTGPNPEKPPWPTPW